MEGRIQADVMEHKNDDNKGTQWKRQQIEEGKSG